MLLTLRVSNFHSVKDPQELSLHRLGRLQHSRELGAEWDAEVSPVAAIYGANAAGKSTIIAAFRGMHQAVRDSYRQWDIDGGTGFVPFALDPESSTQPTEIELSFIGDDGVEYHYGFAATPDRFESEWLYAYRTASRTLIFERETAAASVKFGKSFRGSKELLEQAAVSRENALLLSIGAQLGNEFLQVMYRWVVQQLLICDALGYEAGHRNVVRRVREEPGYAERLVRLLEQADLGVCGVSVHEEPLHEEAFIAARKITEALNGDVDEGQLRHSLRERSAELRLTHRGLAGQPPVTLPFSFESDGTRALIAFADVAMSALESGAVLVIDELDSSLHPLLVVQLVRLFQDPSMNPNQAQLIFTTHDSSLLNSEVLDRDQIWFVEKASSGDTSLVALAEYRPRKGENFERGYLTGRYGGVPYLGLFDALVDPQQKVPA